jgi:amino acid transporter
MGARDLASPRLPVRRVLVGRPLASGELEETLLPKWLALPIFASDPISSVAYATEAALAVLITASLAARSWIVPVSIAIAALLAIVTLSYRQTVRAYESSGGAYVVAKENLGTLPSLVAAAALLTDYVLTVAVSVAAGILAISSAVPSLSGARVPVAVGCIVVITVANLRGVRESGLLFALPTYGFVGVMLAVLAVGAVRCADGTCPRAVTPHPVAAGAGAVTVFLILKAFASGSSALTGVEAIANGVNAFRRPQSQNAARTLLVLGAIAITLFLGVSLLALGTGARPSETTSVLSQVGRASFPEGSAAGVVYYLLQGLTFAILILAANTSFQGFPRLAALLARDRYFPRQFVNLGDRLVLSNGIVVLSGIAIALIVAFGANVDSLIHLYVVGVFTAFTISQAGMVRYWRRDRSAGWRYRAAVNAVGAMATGVVTLLVVQTKFLEGAWIVIAAMPLFVLGFYGIHRHYLKTARRLEAGTDAVRRVAHDVTNEVVLPVRELNDSTRLAVWFVRRVAGSDFEGLYVPRAGARDPRGDWWDVSGGAARLRVLDPREGYADTIREEVWRLPRGDADFVTVVLPEQFRTRSLAAATLRNWGTFTLKLRLLAEPGVVTANVTALDGTASPSPARIACRVLVSGAHAASLRAINYAGTLKVDDARAVFFAFDDEEASRLRKEWARREFDYPLEVVEAPYRDLGDPLLRYIRELTATPGTLALVLLPELVLPGWRKLLHNQRALYVKRLLLFEPGVVLASVPYQLP